MLRKSYSVNNVVWYSGNNIHFTGEGGANIKSQKFLHEIVGVTSVASEYLADFDILNAIYVHSQVLTVKRCVACFRSESKAKYKECYALKLRLKFWFIASAARASTICKVVQFNSLFPKVEEGRRWM